MTALSIILPERLAEASKKAARQLGLSRAEFIRQAIADALEQVEIHEEQRKIKKCFSSMKSSKAYSKLVKELDHNFDDQLSEEPDQWWKK